MSFTVCPSRPMPRNDVQNQGVFQGPLSGHGHGRKVTPKQSQPGCSYRPYVRPQPVQTHTPDVYHHYHNHPVYPPVAYVPNQPVHHYSERPVRNVQIIEQEPATQIHYYPRFTKGHDCNPRNYGHIYSTFSFAGFLAKCVLISALALFMLAILI